MLVQEFRTDLTDDVVHEHNARVLDGFLFRLIGPGQERRTNADATGWITRPHVVSGDGRKMPTKTPVAFAKLTSHLQSKD